MNIRTFRELQRDNIRKRELALFKEFLLFNNLFKEFNALIGGWGYFYNRALLYKHAALLFLIPTYSLHRTSTPARREWFLNVVQEWNKVKDAPNERRLKVLKRKWNMKH